MIRLGAVPYLNAKPLLWGLEGSTEVEVTLDVPSQLPALLGQGKVDAILVSSIEALRHPDLVILPGMSISSFGPVESVRVFHKRPLGEVRTLALDASSLTSNALAQILFHEYFGHYPNLVVHPPELNAMLAAADAAVLIGDRGMQNPPPGVEVWDLGEAWTSRTKLPFVWAVWLARRDFPSKGVQILQDSLARGLRELNEVADTHGPAQGFTVERALAYLSKAIDYRLDHAHQAGLDMFREKLRECTILPGAASLA